LEFFNFPPKLNEVEVLQIHDCAPWVVAPDDLPQAIQDTIGSLDLEDRGVRYLGPMKEELVAQMKSPKQIEYGLSVALDNVPTSETSLYPLANSILQVGGMNSFNKFTVTTEQDPLNKLTWKLKGRRIVAILDVAAWYMSHSAGINQYSLAFGIKIEVKKQVFNYAQFVAQLLSQAVVQVQNNPSLRDDDIIETVGISLCSYHFRFATLSCSVKYIHNVIKGEDTADMKPTLCLSKSYSLLSRNNRAWAVGAVYGRLKCMLPQSQKILLYS